ncbi:DUF456 domain-containing protein [Polycyclovorans algicola]|uniref:DUF456 domain-containing protein n=1 Tax=Polycyclovorans algicola TaxID=616992 RepID=UPI0004A6C072|nr:DUF456 domain-containing protein [Polycyclovorans algicola]
MVEILLWLLVAVLVLVGLAGVILPVLPGVPILFAGLWLAALVDDYLRVGSWTLILLGVMTVFAVAVDFLASVFGAQRVGASPEAIWGALIGSVIGIFFGLPGLLLGPFIGAVGGELIARGGPARATEVGLATWVGLIVGTLVKLAVSLAMLFIFIFAWFW